MLFKHYFLPLILLLLTLSACSDNDHETVTATALQITTISGNTTIPVGFTEEVIAQVTFSDGHVGQVSLTEVALSSSDPTVLTVDADGLVTAVTVNTATINGEYFQDGVTLTDSLTITVTQPVVTAIEVFEAHEEVPLGLTATFYAQATYSDGSQDNLDNSAELVWTSSDTSIATINNTTSKVTAIAEGNTIITATYQNSITSTAELKVIEAVEITLAISAVNGTSVPAGYTIAFTAEASYDSEDGIKTLDVTEQVDWYTANSDILAVSDIKGVYEGKSSGSEDPINIHANFDNTDMSIPADILASNLIAVTVSPAELIDLVIESEYTTVPVGLDYQLKAMAIFSDDTEEDITGADKVTWTSLNPDNATITQEGVLTGLTVESTAMITVNIEGETITGQELYSISAAELTSTEITPDSDYVATGETRQYILTGTYTDDSEHILNLQNNISWTLIDTLSDGQGASISYTDGVQINSHGRLTNLVNNTRSLTKDIRVEARIPVGDDDIYASTITTKLAATRILNISHNDNTLSFIAPMTQGDYSYTGETFTSQAAYSETGTTGPDSGNFVIMDYSTAQSTCDEIVYNKFDDYRLPSHDELQALWSVFDGEDDGTYTLFTEQKWSVGQPFWTSTMVTEGTEESAATYQTVDLMTGSQQNSEPSSSLFYVSCVRGDVFP